MKQLFYLLKKFAFTYLVLFWIFIFSIFSIYFIQFPLSKVPEIWEYGAQFGKVLYDISVGYIISYVFFFLVVFNKNENDKRKISRRLAITSSYIIIEGYEIFCMLIGNNPKFNRKSFSFPPSLEVLEDICKNTDQYNPPSQTNNTRDWHWVVPLQHRKQYTFEYMYKIYQLLPYLDSDLVGILTNIEDSMYFSVSDRVIIPRKRPEGFSSFEYIATDMLAYFELIKQLEEYCVKNIWNFKEQVKAIRIRINAHSYSKDMVPQY